MTETPARKRLPGPGNDGDGTDAEINRKLSEHLRANAIRLDAATERVEPPSDGPGRRAVVAPFRSFGFALAQIAGLGALVILLPLAAIHACFYENEAG
jgi:hypothetical protein